MEMESTGMEIKKEPLPNLIRAALFWFFTLFCGIKIITYKIGIEKEHYLLQNVSCLKLRTEVE